jgi:L-rhamnose mutarotase
MDMNPHQNKEIAVKRVGMVIKLKPAYVEDYINMHAASNAGVRDLLAKYHLNNFSIFLHQIGNEWFEFGYYEYTGTDYERDLAGLAGEPRNQAWLEICNTMQQPLEGENGWAIMKQVYYNDVNL